MIIDNEQCTCHGNMPENCRLCGGDESPGYWCEVCGRAVPEKRCPLCGLKARRIRSAVEQVVG
ncbi:MAG: hypothetical protein H7X83_04805 [Verrucomicrobia bacterium]|nr:hypothetical protein [Deltaproteobacteria bacterium]